MTRVPLTEGFCRPLPGGDGSPTSRRALATGKRDDPFEESRLAGDRGHRRDTRTQSKCVLCVCVCVVCVCVL